MSTRAVTNKRYVEAQDSSVEFFSPVIDLELANRALNYQICWEEGVKGKLIWQASIFNEPFKWETLVNCKSVELEIPGDTPFGQNHSIVSITGDWLTVGFVRFNWRPISDGSSEGNIDVSIRIVPT